MNASVTTLYWTCALFFIPGTISTAMVWLFTRYHYPTRHTVRDVSISHDGDTEVLTSKRSTSSENSDSSHVSTRSVLSGVPHTMSFRIFYQQTATLFRNRIFVLMVLTCCVTEGGYLAFSGSLKQLLLDKFGRTEAEISNDFALIQYFGLAAPLTGFIVDKLRHRQWFLMFGSGIFMFSNISLAMGDVTDSNRICGLLGISIGLLIYGSAFWPSIASVVGKQLQIIAYSWTSAASSFGAMILPLLAGYVTDRSNVENAQYLFMMLSIMSFLICIMIAVFNGASNIDLLNRSIHKSEKKNINERQTSASSI